MYHTFVKKVIVIAISFNLLYLVIKQGFLGNCSDAVCHIMRSFFLCCLVKPRVFLCVCHVCTSGRQCIFCLWPFITIIGTFGCPVHDTRDKVYKSNGCWCAPSIVLETR